MSLTDENSMVMPVSPMYGNNGGGFANGWESWLILLLFFCMFGNGGFGGGYQNQFPFANLQNGMNDGFNQAATAGTLAGIQNGMNAGFSAAEVAACGRAADAMQTAYNNQIASMNQSFAQAQALDGRLDAMATQQQVCCCENRAAVQDLKYTMASEAAQTRAQGTQNTQAILDKLCALELDNVKAQLAQAQRENTALQNQINMASFRADNAAQTATLQADNAAQTAALIQRIAPYPVPAYHANQYPCGNNCGC